MGIATLFFGQNKKTSYGFFTADVLKSETIKMDSEVTNHPIEFGYEISDHVILKPVGIDATLYISDTNIRNGASSGISKVATAYEILKLQRDLKMPFSYVSNLQIFPFCIATSISVPRTEQDGDSISFQLTIQKIEVVPPFGLMFPQSNLGIGTAAALASMVIL